MNTLERWRHHNNEHLAERLARLRSLLRSPEPAAALNPNAVDHGEEFPPALRVLALRLGLSAFEENVLLLCVAMELDPELPALCAASQRDPHRPYPTFALAMALFGDPVWDALSPERPLRRMRLIELSQSGATPLTAAALRADERIVSFVKGLNYLDQRVTPLLLPLDVARNDPLTASQQEVVSRITRELDAHSDSRSPLVTLAGTDRVAKQLVAVEVARRYGLELIRLPAEILPNDLVELETLLMLWEREQRLLPLALYVDAGDADVTLLDRASAPLGRFLARADGLLFLDVADARPLSRRPMIAADVAKPTPSEQRDHWRQSLRGDDDNARELAGQFSLNASEIERLAGGHTDDVSGLWDACRRAARPRLETLARRIDAKATFKDLVLPEEQVTLLSLIASQVRLRSVVYDDWGFRARNNRGLGISVLFAGESGTGKTMAAEALASELRLDLYRIDLSAVVNKYIGETEKNLRRLFDAADDGGAILLFDEADALFGKRTEAKDSHDRYANLEVNYLLQRMESYRGLAILATNIKSALDRAFLRRLRFVVDFPAPEGPQRRELWRTAFPASAPLGDLDYEYLARLNVTGGNIHTIALNAAFAAAAASSPVTMQELMASTKHEYRKLQRPLTLPGLRSGELEGVAR